MVQLVMRTAGAVFMAVVGCCAACAADAPFTFFAFCMDTHDSAKRDLEQQAQMLEELGYDGAGHLWLDKLEERVATLDRHGLKLAQVYFRANVRRDGDPYDARLKDALPMLKGRGTMLALLMSGLPPRDPKGEQNGVRLAGEIADIAAQSGVRVALYPHSGDWLESVDDALRVAEKANRPNLGVMFNLCHFMKIDSESNIEPALKKARPRLYAVSISGSDKADQIHAGDGNWIQPLGSGSFDMPGFLKILRAIGYNGPVGLQCYGIPGDAKAHLAQSIAAWRKYQKGL